MDPVLQAAAAAAAAEIAPRLVELIAAWMAGQDPVRVLAGKSLGDLLPDTLYLDLELRRQNARHGLGDPADADLPPVVA